VNINQHFSNLVTKAAEQDADTSQLITQRDRLFKDKVIPELVKRQANDTEPYRVCRRVNILRDYSDDKIKIYP
jgi:hypothetical protein